jgi:hypothetical protein
VVELGLSKGDRIEKEASKILAGLGREERITEVNTPLKANQDLWGFADLICINRDGQIKLVQAKASEFRDRDYYASQARNFLDHAHVDCEVWIRHDREGWEMYRYDTDADGFVKYWGTPACDPDHVRKALKSEYKANKTTEGGSQSD